MSGSDGDIAEIVLGAGPRDSGLDELFRAHAGWLRKLLSRKLRASSSDIDDVVQDTYLRVARQPAGTIRYPKAFLAQTALNLFRDARRREAVRSDHRRATASVVLSLPNPGSLSEQEAQVEMVRLISEMPEPFRDVFALSRFRHMRNADIATQLGISEKTVEWRMGKALAFCMSRLRD